MTILLLWIFSYEFDIVVVFAPGGKCKKTMKQKELHPLGINWGYILIFFIFNLLYPCQMIVSMLKTRTCKYLCIDVVNLLMLFKFETWQKDLMFSVYDVLHQPNMLVLFKIPHFIRFIIKMIFIALYLMNNTCRFIKMFSLLFGIVSVIAYIHYNTWKIILFYLNWFYF